jgi:glycosyltransferase involved in cell wall biosynthesis
MKVLQVSPFFPARGGGIEVVALKLAEGHAHAGCDVVWMAGAAPGEDLPVVEHVRVAGVRYLDPLSSLNGLPLPIWGLRGTAVLWREVGVCDVVHIHDYLYQPCLIAVLFAKLRRKPVILTQHIGELPVRSAVVRGTVSLLNRVLGRLVLGAVDQVVFVSATVQQYFARFCRFSRSALMVPNGVDHSVYSPGPGGGGGSVQLLFVGRFVEKKGIQHLRPLMGMPGVEWTLLGSGPESPLRWNELPPSVTVREDVRGGDVAGYYQVADLLVLPSIGEGFPLVVQESLACGTPVLVERRVAEACPNRDERCVFEVDLSGSDPAAELQRRIGEIISDRMMLAEGRVHAAKLARQWSWDAAASSYRDLYANVS